MKAVAKATSKKQYAVIKNPKFNRTCMEKLVNNFSLESGIRKDM
jgi:hypothetical protein